MGSRCWIVSDRESPVPWSKNYRDVPSASYRNPVKGALLAPMRNLVPEGSVSFSLPVSVKSSRRHLPLLHYILRPRWRTSLSTYVCPVASASGRDGGAA